LATSVTVILSTVAGVAARVVDEPPPSPVLDESILHRGIGDEAVTCEQVQRLTA
jgi:hypothetical protein